VDSTPSGTRPVERDCPPLGSGRLRRVWLLGQPLRYFRGLRLHLLTTLHGLPVSFAITGAKGGERKVLLGRPLRQIIDLKVTISSTSTTGC
jgi:hypothetical protein